MAYIGKSPSTKFSAAAKVDTFTGDGSTVAFDLANIIPAGGENGLQVFVNNVRQKPGASNAFTVGNDGSGDLKRITFTAAPDASDEIYVITTFEATNITEVGDGTITSAKIADGAIVNADLNASAAIADSKLASITTASKVNISALSAPGSASVFLRGDRTYGAMPTDLIDTNAFNISLLGFKMAVNEGLTVFNLVDGIVDEFHDESGTDEAEGSNDLYNASSDYYINSTTPDGSPTTPISAGFSLTAITEPQTSTAGNNPAYGEGAMGTFTVPACTPSVNIAVWGASGGYSGQAAGGAGGGYAEGTLAVTASQTLHIIAGEGGGSQNDDSLESAFLNGGATSGSGGPSTYYAGGGGGLSGVFAADLVPLSAPQYSAPQAYVIAGSGGASGNDNEGGAGGGLTGGQAGPFGGPFTFSNCGSASGGGGGGDQEAGGHGVDEPSANDGTLFSGATGASPTSRYSAGGGGAGYYGGGAGARTSGGQSTDKGGGGGSSYYGHPQITSGSTEAGAGEEGGGVDQPLYVADTNEGSPTGSEDGYVFITVSQAASATATTIVSEPFAAGTVPTTSRIVVFEENVATPTLNTDIIASISRDGGSNFTTATLADSGYVTGTSGQRILTGQATISGQPSGQSMRWKLALANNSVKVHGVSLQWA